MKKTILVVDDFDNSRFVIVFTLQQKGYNVLQAASGKDALTIFENNTIDLLITDYNMPVMNGLELVEKIKSLYPSTRLPILVLSTDIDARKKQAAFDAGVTAWVKKPFDIPLFIKTVEKALK